MGRYKDKWLFPEFGIDSKGTVVPLDREVGCYVLDDEPFAPPKNDSDAGIMYPVIPAMPSSEEVETVDTADLLSLLETNQGSLLAWGLLGWVGATFFKDAVIEMNWGFPVAYITGNSQSGKTTLATWILSTYGMMHKTAGGATSSAYGINKVSCMYGNLPLWFDDIRDLGEGGVWNKVVLGAYENAMDYKGTISGSVAVPSKYNSTLLITSEFFLKSPAAMNRCCRFVADDTVQDRSAYKEICLLVNKVLPGLGLRMAVKSQLYRKAFKADVLKTKDYLVEQGIKERAAQNYAVIYAGFMWFFKELIDEQPDILAKFREYLVPLIAEEVKLSNSANYAESFLADFSGMLESPTYSMLFKRNEQWFTRGNMWHIYTAELYELWRRYKGYNASFNLIDRNDFIAQLRRLKCAKRNSTGTVKVDGKLRTCISLDLDVMKESTNPEVQVLAENLLSDDIVEII